MHSCMATITYKLFSTGNNSEVENYDVTTETLYVTLSTKVDYEVSTSYTLILEVIDYLKVPALTGQVTVKVNCFRSEMFLP